jgi:hypothetical protein
LTPVMREDADDIPEHADPLSIELCKGILEHVDPPGE